MTRRSDAEALAALLEGRASPDDAPRSLSRLAGLATAVRDHTELETPTEHFRDRLRADLLEAARAGRPTMLTRTRDRVDDATARVRHSLRAAGAAAVASTLIGTAGVAAAAQSALPGDPLYSIKAFTEDARLAFASGDVERGRLHLAFARERLDEVAEGRERLAPGQLTATLDQLDREAAAGAEELLEAVSAEEQDAVLLDELDGFTAEVRRRILQLQPDLPLSVHPAAERTLEVLRRIEVQVAGLLDVAPSCDACAPGTSSLPRVVLPGDGPAAGTCQCVRPGAADAGQDDAPAAGPPATEPPRPTATQAPAVDDRPSGEQPAQVPTSGGDLVGDVGNAVDDAVDGVADGVTVPLDDLGTMVDDLLDPRPGSTGSLGGAVGDTASELGDAVDGVGNAVEDTASELGGLVDGLGDGLVD